MNHRTKSTAGAIGHRSTAQREQRASVSCPVSPSPDAGHSTDASLALGKLAFGSIAEVKLGYPLGQGAFGVVYSGRWRGLKVAVKAVLFSGWPDLEDKGRAEKVSEATAASSAAGPVEKKPKKQRCTSMDQAINEAATCISLVHRNVVSDCGHCYPVDILDADCVW